MKCPRCMAREALEHPEVADIRADRLPEAAGRMRAVLAMIADGRSFMCADCMNDACAAFPVASAYRIEHGEVIS